MQRPRPSGSGVSELAAFLGFFFNHYLTDALLGLRMVIADCIEISYRPSRRRFRKDGTFSCLSTGITEYCLLLGQRLWDRHVRISVKTRGSGLVVPVQACAKLANDSLHRLFARELSRTMCYGRKRRFETRELGDFRRWESAEWHGWVRSLDFASLVKSIYDAYPDMRVNSIFQD